MISFFKQSKQLLRLCSKVRTTQISMLALSKQFMLNQQFAAFYHKNVLNEFENPKNVGSLDKKAKRVGTGLVGAPSCGDVMQLQILVKEDGKTIERAVFKTFGCGSAIACSSYVTEQLKGKTLEEARTILNQDIANYLKLPAVKMHCSMLAEDSVKRAIQDYLDKNKSTLDQQTTQNQEQNQNKNQNAESQH